MDSCKTHAEIRTSLRSCRDWRGPVHATVHRFVQGLVQGLLWLPAVNGAIVFEVARAATHAGVPAGNGAV